MANLYLAKDLEWLRAKRDELFELLDKGRITRTVENGQTTEFSESEKVDLQDLLSKVMAAIATKTGATDEEIAAAVAIKPKMKVHTTYADYY